MILGWNLNGSCWLNAVKNVGLDVKVPFGYHPLTMELHDLPMLIDETNFGLVPYNHASFYQF